VITHVLLGQGLGENGKHGRTETDEHVGAQAGRLMPQFTLKADEAAENRRHDQPQDCRRDHARQFSAEAISH